MSYKADNPFEESSSENPFEEEKPALPPKNNSDKKNAPPTPAKDSNYYNSNMVRQEQVIAQFNSPFDTSPEGIKKKELELKRREEELSRREKSLLDKEKQIDKATPKLKNWPRCRPIIYHDIDGEIPANQQRLVKAGYYIWFGTLFCYFYNFVSVLAGLIASGGGSEIASFILSIINCLFFMPMTFLIYRLLYRATRKGKSGLYLGYMICLWIDIIWFAWNGVGLRGWGGGGFLLMLGLFQDDKTAAAVICLVCIVFWGLLVVAHLYLFIHARINYKLVGGWGSAKKQAASGAIQIAKDNPELVKEGAKAYVNSQKV